VTNGAAQRRRQPLIDHGQVRRILLQDCVHRLDGRVAAKRMSPGQHFVEHRAEREDVRAMIRTSTADLLGRHVAHRSKHQAVGSLCTCQRRRGRIGSRNQTGQAEVENLHVTVCRHEDVLWLEVAMNDAFVVSGGKRARDLDRDVDRAARWHRRRPQPLAQRAALEQLHHGVGHAVCAPEVVDRENAGMRQRGDRLRFALEARDTIGIGRELPGQDLDRDKPIQLRIARAIDLAHAAGANRPGHFVRAEACARGQRHE
jgi:hypothetical protein